MRPAILASALSLMALLPITSSADELNVNAAPDDTVSTPVPTTLPRKGTLKSAVLKQFGKPQTQHSPVGGDSPKHPPITRWDYAEFSVFFENDHVVDAVVPGHPAPVFHTETLKAAASNP